MIRTIVTPASATPTIANGNVVMNSISN